MRLELTVKELVAKLVGGIKKEFLSTQEKSKLVDFLLDNSAIQLSDTYFQMTNFNRLGLGSIREEVVVVPKYLTLALGTSNILDTDTDKYIKKGLAKRFWTIQSHYNLESLEGYLKSLYFSDYNNENYADIVVLVDGVLADFEVQKGIIREVPRQWVYWKNLKPYTLYFTQDEERIVEHMECKRMVELRILQILTEGATDLIVYNNLDDERLDFYVSSDIYNSSLTKQSKKLEFQWFFSSSEEDEYPEEDED